MLSLGAGSAAAENEDVVGEILELMRERGIVDDEEYRRLAVKNQQYQAEQQSWMPKIGWSGDLRFRHESFWYDRDEIGFERDNRYRIRYRLRLKGEVDINEWADVVFRLASGDDDPRSTNQTLGSSLDFDSDDIRLDLAYANLKAPSSWLPFPEGTLMVQAGKVPNPFRWKVGKDFMLWDGDITFEGASVLVSSRPTEWTTLFANFGYYIDDENSQAKDPHFWGLQAGAHQKLSEDVVLGARASWYEFRSINTAFNVRGATGGVGVTSGGGNIGDGLNGDITGEDFSVIETAAYVTFNGIERWPISVYGDYSRNLDAETSKLFPGASDEDTAWGVGVEIGDKKEFAKLGLGYWHIEANAFPSMFIESDLFDGRTNREGFAVYGSRQVMENVDLNLTLFVSDEIEDHVPPFGASVANAERTRLQADLIFKF